MVSRLAIQRKALYMEAFGELGWGVALGSALEFPLLRS